MYSIRSMYTNRMEFFEILFYLLKFYGLPIQALNITNKSEQSFGDLGSFCV